MNEYSKANQKLWNEWAGEHEKLPCHLHQIQFIFMVNSKKIQEVSYANPWH
jgi:hypothetical protein